MFFLEKHVIRGGGAVVYSLGKKTHPVLFLQSRGPLENKGIYGSVHIWKNLTIHGGMGCMDVDI